MGIESVGRDQGPVDAPGPLLLDVVRDVIADVAPEELPLLAGLRHFDEAEIDRRLARRPGRDDPLGFGMGEVVVLAAPVVWAAVRHVASRLADKAVDKAVDGLQPRVSRMLRGKRHHRKPAASLSQFSHDDVAQVRSTVLELARQVGMKQARAEQLAASVADRLTYGKPDQHQP